MKCLMRGKKITKKIMISVFPKLRIQLSVTTTLLKPSTKKIEEQASRVSSTLFGFLSMIIK
jgi:hypothetical protein